MAPTTRSAEARTRSGDARIAEVLTRDSWRDFSRHRSGDPGCSGSAMPYRCPQTAMAEKFLKLPAGSGGTLDGVHRGVHWRPINRDIGGDGCGRIARAVYEMLLLCRDLICYGNANKAFAHYRW